MYHYTYKVVSQSGKFYVGRHSTENIDDGYVGSGKWVRSIKDTNILEKEILDFYDDFDSLVSAEQKLIAEHINDPNNMNFNLSPVGFSTGKMNPAKDNSERKKRSERVSGDGNPAKMLEVRIKISRSLKRRFLEKENHPMFGKFHTETSKNKIRDSKIGSCASPETKLKLSDINRNRVLSGKNPDFTMKGKNHSVEAKARMAKAQQNRQRKICPYCGKESAVNTYARWHGEKCIERDRLGL